jgi:hypothetical protein
MGRLGPVGRSPVSEDLERLDEEATRAYIKERKYCGVTTAVENSV